MAVTIRDVAKKANVSIATVSRVINGSSSISNATIKKVNEVIDELGFIPSSLARNFANKRTNTVAFISKVKKNFAFLNPHHFEIMVGVQRNLAKKGFRMEFFNLQNPDSEQFRQIIESKFVDGLVLHASAINKEIADYLVKSEFPHVVIGTPNFPCTVCWIDNDNILSGGLAARHLLEIKKKNISFIGGKADDLISESRLSGARKEVQDAGLAIFDNRIFKIDSDHNEAYLETLRIIKNDSEIDGIICANNSISFGVMKALNEMNILVPKNIAVITFDEYPYAVITDPPISSINIDVYELGKRAAYLLLDKIKKPNYQFQIFMAVPSLVVRESTVKVK